MGNEASKQSNTAAAAAAAAMQAQAQAQAQVPQQSRQQLTAGQAPGRLPPDRKDRDPLYHSAFRPAASRPARPGPTLTATPRPAPFFPSLGPQ